MAYDCGVDLIKDIYTDGLTSDVIDRNKDSFSGVSLVIHKEGKFIQANEAVICFEESKNSITGVVFTTTNPFPTDESLELLCRIKNLFYSASVFETNRKIQLDGILDNSRQKRIFKSVFPKVCIFYIYRGEVLIDWPTIEDVAVDSSSNSDLKINANAERLHTVFWGKYMINQYPELVGKSYLSVPRGRVIFDNKVFKIFLDKEYFDNVEIRKYIEKECQLSRSVSCGYSIEYIKSPHYDYTKYK